jgi:hypothetical protein
MHSKVQVVRMDCFWVLWKVQNEVFPTVPPGGQTVKMKALKPRVNAANLPKYLNKALVITTKAMKAYGNLGGKWEMGQESE